MEEKLRFGISFVLQLICLLSVSFLLLTDSRVSNSGTLWRRGVNDDFALQLSKLLLLFK